jgi:flavin reductase (DIM6/NTAB) family NADH-FMN oxidoreductase RutF
MSVSSEQFRNALRHFPAGVTIVTIKSDNTIHGLTVSAFASISPEPPLIMIAIDHRHSAYKLLEEEAVFAVNILHQDQMELSNRFAWLKDEDRFEAGEWSTATTGAPILTDALAWLDCTIYARYVAGTHTLYVGEVQATDAPRADEPPLVYWNRGYRQLQLRDEKTVSPEEE